MSNRPSGITALAVLIGLPGAVMLAIAAAFPGYDALWLLIVLLSLSLIALASGIYAGNKWAWRIYTGYVLLAMTIGLFEAACCSLAALWLAVVGGDALTYAGYAARGGVGALIAGAFASYMLRPDVKRFFGVSWEPPRLLASLLGRDGAREKDFTP